MSIRHYASDVEEFDEPTYHLLGSRLSKLALHGERHEVLRQRREHDDVPRRSHKPRRPRDRHVYE